MRRPLKLNGAPGPIRTADTRFRRRDCSWTPDFGSAWARAACRNQRSTFRPLRKMAAATVANTVTLVAVAKTPTNVAVRGEL